MSVRTRILIVGLVPTAFFLTASVLHLVDAAGEARIANTMLRNAALFRVTSELIAELQRERGRTAIFFAGQADSEELREQRGKTDLQRTAFSDALRTAAVNATAQESGARTVRALEALREHVDARSTTAVEAFNQYTAVVAQLITVLGAVAEAPSTKGVGKRWSSLLILEEAKESAGRLRARVSTFLGSNAPLTSDQLTEMIRHKAGIELNLHSRALTLSPEVREQIVRLDAGSNWAFVEQTTATIIAKAQTGAFGVPTRAYWVEISALIDGIGACIGEELQRVETQARLVSGEAVGSAWFTLGALVVTFASVLALAFLFAGRVVRPIRQTVAVLRDIADGEGDLTKRLAVTGQDEIEELATCFNRVTVHGFEGKREGWGRPA